MNMRFAIGDYMTTFEMLDAVHDERSRQDRRFGPQQHSPERWLVILTEELGEYARSIYEDEYATNPQHMAEELVQIAAVAVAALESLNADVRGEVVG